ncbi:MAG: RnfABCDGE type electron transport complex subunit B, partial [Betaproteobacteria bacterium]
CPVDAIMGASKRMHTVIAELCTGCELCLPPCPVDCIVIEPLPAETPAWSKADAQAARARFLARNARLVRLAQRRAESTARKRSIIEAVIQRSRERAAVQPDPAKPPSKTPPKPGEAPP